MTTPAHYESRDPVRAIVDHQSAAIARLTDWARAADAAYEVARRLVDSAFVPQAFRGKPIEATAAILAGLEVGLQPMAALKSFDVIQDQAAPRALALRAIVQSFGHEMVLVESTSTRCRMKGLRRGSSEWQQVTWTIDRAKEMGLTGKDNWRKQPGAMLVARATGEMARLIAADAILGLGYTAEEVADGGVVEQQVAAETVEAEPTRTRKMSRRPRVEAPEPERETEEQPLDADPDPAESGELATDAQHKMMRSLVSRVTELQGEDGKPDRDKLLAFTSDVTGAPIQSSKELTKTQMSRLIDALNAETS